MSVSSLSNIDKMYLSILEIKSKLPQRPDERREMRERERERERDVRDI